MSTFLSDFIINLRREGLEYFNVYYGIYRAKVVSNKDPEQRGRVKIFAHGIHRGDKTGAPDVWVDPAFNGCGPNRGQFWPPDEGDDVRVAFLRGNPSLPNIYWGGWYAKLDDSKPPKTVVHPDFKYSSAGYPEKRGMVTRAGHRLIFDDEAGKEAIRIIWHKPSSPLKKRDETADPASGSTASISISNGGIVAMNQVGAILNMASSGTITLTDPAGNTFIIQGAGISMVDSSGNFISLAGGQLSMATTGQLSMTAPTVSVEAGGITLGGQQALEPLVLGNQLIQWLTSHTHPTGTGPSGPPVIPPPPSILSTANKTK